MLMKYEEDIIEDDVYCQKLIENNNIFCMNGQHKRNASMKRSSQYIIAVNSL